MDLRAFSSRGDLFESLAEELIEDVRGTRDRADGFAWALAGGTTPRGFYELLAQSGFAGRLDAERMHWFWGDERAVPPDDPASNFGMAKASLLDHLDVDPSRVHRMHGELPVEFAAEQYEAMLRRRAADRPDRPLFDWVLLGLGTDGHTASLFPEGAWFDDRESWVRAEQDRHGNGRITLTPEALGRARRVVFLVTGADTAEVLRTVVEGPLRPTCWPAQAGARGPAPVSFRVDAAAAALLR